MQETLSAKSDPTYLAAQTLVWGAAKHCVRALMAWLDVNQSWMPWSMKALRQGGLGQGGLVSDRRDTQWGRFRHDNALAPGWTAVINVVSVTQNASERKTA